MDDEWTFYHAQLAGEEPDCTPGKPWSGFYMLRRRTTRENDDPGRRPGDPRKRVTVEHLPVAIWRDDLGWQCRIGRENSFEYLNDVDAIDVIFSKSCREAIDFDTYEREVKNG